MRTRFDQFTKRMAQAGFSPGGPVQTDQEVSPDARRIDVWFTPAVPDVERILGPLGLLGRMGFTACTLEAFHRTPGGLEVMDCVCKHHLFRGALSKRASPPPLPVQWIVSSGRPEAALSGLRFEPSKEWGPGIHEGPPLTFTRLVVVADLPATRDTVLVRLMGAGAVIRQAMADLHGLPLDAPERALALPILLGLRLEMIEKPVQATEDDLEFIMSTQELVEKFIQEQRRAGIQQGIELGRQEGRQEGMRQDILDVFTERFGAPPADVAALVARTEDVTVLRGWLKLVARASKEEALASMRGSSDR